MSHCYFSTFILLQIHFLLPPAPHSHWNHALSLVENSFKKIIFLILCRCVLVCLCNIFLVFPCILMHCTFQFSHFPVEIKIIHIFPSSIAWDSISISISIFQRWKMILLWNVEKWVKDTANPFASQNAEINVPSTIRFVCSIPQRRMQRKIILPLFKYPSNDFVHSINIEHCLWSHNPEIQLSWLAKCIRCTVQN